MSLGRFKCKNCGKPLWDLADLIYHECEPEERDEGFQEYRDSSSQTPKIEDDGE